MTDEHLSHLKYYEQDRGGYPSERRKEGYMETAVEWLSIRVQNGWELPGTARGVVHCAKAEPSGSCALVDGDGTAGRGSEENDIVAAGSKRKTSEEGGTLSNKPRKP